MIAPASAQESHDIKITEHWVWDQIFNDKKADLDERCKGEDNPQSCTQISVKFLADVLTKKEVRDWIPRNRVRLRGLRIDGDEIKRNDIIKHVIDLTNAEVTVEVWIESSTINGDLLLDGSHWSRLLDIRDSNLDGSFSASRIRSDSDIRLRNNVVKGDTDLFDAKIGGELILDGSLFVGPLTGESMRVTGSLLMRHNTRFGDRVDLVGATIGGNISLRDATIWRLDLSGVVARELLLRGVGWSCAGGYAAPTHWILGASDWQGVQCGTSTPDVIPTLILRNAHVDALQDSPDAWAPSLDLEGFRYDRLGGLGGQGRDDMRRRSVEEWTDWLKRDRTFTMQPYAELASVLSVAGHPGTADDIRFKGRERERREVCARCGGFFQCIFDVCGWLTSLSWAAGYGIGLYTFRVLTPVLIFTILGIFCLSYSPNARIHTMFWRAGASLHRLLPIVSLSKEFDNFFDNTPTDLAPLNLNRFQAAYFAVHAIVGWVLGLILLAAISGLLQKG
jgi:hypothetical protein